MGKIVEYCENNDFIFDQYNENEMCNSLRTMNTFEIILGMILRLMDISLPEPREVGRGVVVCPNVNFQSFSF